jgi:hypothetical protein
MNLIESIRKQFSGLTVAEALMLLMNTYNVPYKNFIFDSHVYTIKEALNTLPSYLLAMDCDKFGILRFYGGPPGKSKWRDGYLLTLLCDIVLYLRYSLIELPYGCN